jgi:hypothetical protein
MTRGTRPIGCNTVSPPYRVIDVSPMTICRHKRSPFGSPQPSRRGYPDALLIT